MSQFIKEGLLAAIDGQILTEQGTWLCASLLFRLSLTLCGYGSRQKVAFTRLAYIVGPRVEMLVPRARAF